MIDITSHDGFVFSAYEAKPPIHTLATPKGRIIILQEIFGINTHIIEVCDDYAAQGWHVLAPALFDRSSPDIFLNYDGDGIAEGRNHKTAIDPFAEGDILATINHSSMDGPVIIIGYCWGGSLAWRMACRYDGIDIAISYYGGELPSLIDERPRCRVQAHFGEKDGSIPMDGVHKFMAAHPDVESYVYDADHGFNCDHRPQYDEAAAMLARHRVNNLIDC